MKKNTILYLLILVLLIMNCFFLYNYLGRPSHKGPKESGKFIVKELNFTDKQLQQFNVLETKHHNTMKTIGDETKSLKNELFEKITATSINKERLDSLFSLVSKKEIIKEKEIFNRLRAIYNICDDQQKDSFSSIIKKARRFDRKGPKNHPKRD